MYVILLLEKGRDMIVLKYNILLLVQPTGHHLVEDL